MRTPNSKCEICSKPLYRQPFELKKVKHICCKNCRSDLYKKYKNYNAEGLEKGHGWNKGMSKSKGDNLSYGKPRSDETKRLMSEAHKGKQTVERIKMVCKECTETKELLPSELKRSGGFCSLICANRYNSRHRTYPEGKDNPNWRGGEIERICPICGEGYPVQRCKAKKSKHCSLICKYEAHRRFMVETPPFVQTRNTDIERLLGQWLNKHNIKFEEQKPVEKVTTVDFFIEPNLCLYADGDYWHNKEDVRQRDKRINEALRIKGYKVVRLLGSEIKKGIRYESIFN